MNFVRLPSDGTKKIKFIGFAEQLLTEHLLNNYLIMYVPVQKILKIHKLGNFEVPPEIGFRILEMLREIDGSLKCANKINDLKHL